MNTRRRRLAVALADAFLAGEWTSAGLLAGALRVLEVRHRWTRRLTRDLLQAHPHPPSDRPRELAAFIELSAALDEVQRRATRHRRPFPAPVHRITEPTAMVRRPFPVTPVNHAGELAELLHVTIPELLWLADTKSLLRRSGSPRLHHYRSRWVTTGGRVRLLESPLPRLKTIQRRILDEMLTPIPVHDAAHGFVRGRSVRTGAAPHTAAELLICLDLESFFASITGDRIYGIFRSAGYPEPVAHLLTGLCTHATPVHVLSSVPVTAESTFRIRRRLAAPHLPQGAPSSPQLANLCAFHLDRRLAAYASAIGATYTRYADDLTFSGSDLKARHRGVVAAASRIVREEGFALNPGKTRHRGRDDRQLVTGIVVNTATRVPTAQYDLLRAILHNCVIYGPQSQNRFAHNDFRAHLRGRIAWVAALDAEQGRRLMNSFERIQWDQSFFI